MTFLERMLRVSEENKEFTLENVRAEATNTLTAVKSIYGIDFIYFIYKQRCFYRLLTHRVGQLHSHY